MPLGKPLPDHKHPAFTMFLIAACAYSTGATGQYGLENSAELRSRTSHLPLTVAFMPALHTKDFFYTMGTTLYPPDLQDAAVELARLGPVHQHGQDKNIYFVRTMSISATTIKPSSSSGRSITIGWNPG